MVFGRRLSLLIPILVMAMILSSVSPYPVLADDEVPPAESTPEVTVTPEIPTAEPGSNEISDIESATNKEGETPLPVGMDVVVPDARQETTDEQGMSLDKLVSTLPIWCPVDVEPVPGENGCTAEFGSVSLLMAYLNENAVEGDGTIWMADTFQDSGTESGSDQSQNAEVITDAANGSTGNGAGLNVIILDSSGAPVSPDSGNLPGAILDGQPVWCPDGTTPYSGGDGCAASIGSMGLLVSMMENGSLEDGAIYIQTTVEPVNEIDDPVTEPSTINSDAVENVSLPEDDVVSDDGMDDVQSLAVDEAAAVEENIPAVNQEPTEDDPASDPVLHDPIWCPALTVPDPGNGGCTPAQPSLQTLISFLALPGNEPVLDGTIWIENGVDASAGSIVIDGNVFTNWRSSSLTLQGGWSGISGDSSITGNTTFSQSISIINWMDNVAVNETVVQGTAATGLTISTTGNISLDNVTSSGNAVDGASLDNSAGAATDVTLSGSNSFNNNLDDGLVVQTTGDIDANQITAQGNGDEGAVLINSSGTGSVTLTGANDYSNNGLIGNSGSGLSVGSSGPISINDITASNNTLRGAFLQTTGNAVTLTGVNSFVGNDTNGLWIQISGGGSIDLQNITATNNTSNGALLTIANGVGSGAVNILGINAFNNNSSDGISNGLNISTYGDINLGNITASGNQGNADGVILGTSANVIINNGSINNNAGYGFEDGLALPVVPASVTLDSVSFYCNGLGDYSINSPVTFLIAVSNLPCVNVNSGGSGSNAAPAQPAALPIRVVNLQDASTPNPHELDCTQYGGTELVLSNGDRVIYLCPTLGDAGLARVEQNAENFPGNLPGNTQFMSAMETRLSLNGVDQSLTTGNLIISFIIPVDMVGFEFAILYYDGVNWQDLSTGSFADGRRVFLKGIKTEDGRFEASTNFTGLYVLVRK